jgi:hypothetical protein
LHGRTEDRIRLTRELPLFLNDQLLAYDIEKHALERYLDAPGIGRRGRFIGVHAAG